MVQWSPDTTPADRHGRGGYDYRDSHVKGFSLTHLAGAGCPLYGDFPFMPTTATASNPRRPPRRHRRLGGAISSRLLARQRGGEPRLLPRPPQPARTATAIGAELTRDHAHRAGPLHLSAQPPRQRRSINAGGSARPTTSPRCEIDPRRRAIDGSASSGYFCGQRPRYRVYFAAGLRPPVRRLRHLGSGAADAGSTVRQRQPRVGDARARPRRGRRLRDLRHPPQPHRRRPRRRLVRQRRGRARQSRRRGPGPRLRPRSRGGAESAGTARSAGSASAAAARANRHLLHRALPRRASRRGPSATSAAATWEWTAAVHHARGHTQYADFSGWDIYRSEIQLLSILAPAPRRRHRRLAARRRRRRAAACRAGPTPRARA